MKSIKIIFFIVLFYSSIFSFSKEIDSILIVKKSFLQFVNVNKSNIHTLKYQLYLKDVIPLMEKHKFDVRSFIILSEDLAKKYLKELQKAKKFKEMKDLISLQRYATLDNSVYGETMMRLHNFFGEYDKIIPELKNLLTTDKISYKNAVSIFKQISPSKKIISQEFNTYIPNKKTYNRFYFYLLSIYNPLQSVMELPKFLVDDKVFLQNNLSEIIKNIDNKVILNQYYKTIDSRLGNSIKYDILLQQKDIEKLKSTYPVLSYSQKIKFVDMILKDMIKNEEFKDFSQYIDSIKSADYTINMIRYKTAQVFRNNGDIFQLTDSIKLTEKVKEDFYFEMALFQLFAENKSKISIISKYKNLKENFNDETRFNIWNSFYESLNHNKKKEIFNLLKASIKLDLIEFKALAQELKQHSIDKKVLISFLEQKYYSVKYPNDEILEWYSSLKFLPDGEFIMLSSEHFFDSKAIKDFYTLMLETETDERWINFLENRISSL